MADPLSAAASVVGLITFGLQVIKGLTEYYQDFKAFNEDIKSIISKIEDVNHYLNMLKETLVGQKSSEDQSLVRSIESSVSKSKVLLDQLQKKCDKVQQKSSTNPSTLRQVYERTAYPFKKSTLAKIEETLDEILKTISPPLDLLQLKGQKRTHVIAAETKSLVELVRATQVNDRIRRWLNAPDATTNHNAACAKSHAGTGEWLLRSTVFESWLKDKNSFMWLNGFAGCGKSVLCSTAIQHTFRHRKSIPNTGIALFYLTFSDESKQDASSMLRALLLQLSSQHSSGRHLLQQLKKSHPSSTPPVAELSESFKSMVKLFTNVYIFVDAIDESPSSKRDEVLDTVNLLRGWKVDGLHLLITSRDRKDIRDAIQLLTHEDVAVRNDGVDKDIASYVATRLDTDRRLRKWRENEVFCTKIQDSLTQRAQGVFRWVDCQFQLLQTCPCSPHLLDRLLTSLPKDLDETYERMLLEVQARGHGPELQRILLVLCYAVRPVTIPELIEALATDVDDQPGLKLDWRLESEDDVLIICSGLVEVGTKTEVWTGPAVSVARLAHFSVQEYLKSGRLTEQVRTCPGFDPATGQQLMTELCLAYLSDPGMSLCKDEVHASKNYPLARYAMRHWPEHYRRVSYNGAKLDNRVLEFFTTIDHYDKLKSWFIQSKPLYGSFRCTHHEYHDTSHDGRVIARLYDAAYLGLERIYPMLLQNISPSDNLHINNVTNGDGLYYDDARPRTADTALHAACSQGHIGIVAMLLGHGGNVSFSCWSNCFTAACKKSSIDVAKLLLKWRPDYANFFDISDGALQQAALENETGIMRLLLQIRRDFRSLDLTSVPAEALRFLLENGMNPEESPKSWLSYKPNGTHLFHAASKNLVEQVQLLLDFGADPNADYGIGTALHAVCSKLSYPRRVAKNHVRVASLLLGCQRMDVNAQDADSLTPLIKACYSGSTDIVALLLNDSRIDTSSSAGQIGTALCLASMNGHRSIVKMLLDKGADANNSCLQIDGGPTTPLVEAATQGFPETVKLLLDHGANISLRSKFGTALEVASRDFFTIIHHSWAEEEFPGLKERRYERRRGEADVLAGRKAVVELLLERGAARTVLEIQEDVQCTNRDNTSFNLRSDRGGSPFSALLGRWLPYPLVLAKVSSSDAQCP